MLCGLLDKSKLLCFSTRKFVSDTLQRITFWSWTTQYPYWFFNQTLFNFENPLTLAEQWCITNITWEMTGNQSRLLKWNKPLWALFVFVIERSWKRLGTASVMEVSAVSFFLYSWVLLVQPMRPAWGRSTRFSFCWPAFCEKREICRSRRTNSILFLSGRSSNAVCWRAVTQLTTPVAALCYNLTQASLIEDIRVSTFSVLSFLYFLANAILPGVSQGLKICDWNRR